MKALLASIFFVSACLVVAQTPSSAPGNDAQTKTEHRYHADPQKQLAHLTSKLALTADQQARILPLLNERQQKIASLEGDNTLSAKDRREKMHALRSEYEGKIRGVLTDTQLTAYDQMRQEARERARTHRQTSVQ
jgi:hypothetical protein